VENCEGKHLGKSFVEHLGICRYMEGLSNGQQKGECCSFKLDVTLRWGKGWVGVVLYVVLRTVALDPFNFNI
jgi:hypothetical protein